VINKKVLIAYASMSENTEEVAKIIEEQLVKKGFGVDMLYIGINSQIGKIDEEAYRAVFIGTYTWDLGFAPDEISDFAEVNDFKNTEVYSFGTGETQFGDDLFCVASDKIAKYYNSPTSVLKIEQSPRGRQENKVIEWVEKVTRNMNRTRD